MTPAGSRCEPGTTAVAPFSNVKSDRANMQLRVTSRSSLIASGQLFSSRCRYWAGSPGPTAMTWLVLSQ